MALVHRDKHVAEWPVLRLPERWGWPFDAGDGLQWLRVEEFHDGGDLVVRAELPDIDPDKDVEITTEGGVARIHARREQSSEKKDKEGYRSEFRYGDFDREIALPPGATSKDVKATYKDGILEVRIPCPAEPAESATKVPISRA
ncbi:MAG: Hsp20/alpha crystallin family protein [Acidimicrobiales bacterium]|jgi:HSP20 family protein